MKKLLIALLVLIAIGSAVYFTHSKKIAVVNTGNTQPGEVVVLDTDTNTDIQTPDETAPGKNPEPTKPTLEQVIDQHLIIGFRGLTIQKGSDIEKILDTASPGGVILFDYDSPTKGAISRNIQSSTQVKKLIASLQASAKTKLFVSIDQEGGQVNRLKSKYGFSVQTPSAKEIAGHTLQQAYDYDTALVKQIKNLGFNLNFGTVVDLDYGNAGAAIGKYERAYSSSPDTVIAYAKQSLAAHKSQNIISTIKHFPGHGSAQADTHKGFVDITNVYEQKELTPFKSLATTAPAIMVAHVYNKNVDPVYPASMSPAYIRMLKKDLGFTGLIITDDMQMKAIKDTYGVPLASVQSLKAGVDMVIISNNIDTYDKEIFFKVRNAIVVAVKDGTLSETDLRKSYDKILAVKKQYGIVQ